MHAKETGMSEETQAIFDSHAISQVVTDWGFARDQGDWEGLKACFHADATVEIMWIAGSAHEFVESFKKRPPQKPGESTKHQVGTPKVRISGERAVSECHLTLFSRVLIDEIEFDFTAWVRFLDLFEKREGAWRIFRRTAIYEKDRMDPVTPNQVPVSYFDSVQLADFPPECRFMCFRHAKHGRGMAPHIVTANSETERARREEGRAWLNGS